MDTPPLSGNTGFYGRLVLLGWVGEHPVDFADFPMLMAYTPGDGPLGPGAAQQALREVVAGWGIRMGGMVANPVIGGTAVTASLDGTIVKLSGFPGLAMSRPTSAEWAEIARRRRQVFFSLTTRPWPQGPAAHEDEYARFIEDERTIDAAVSMLVPLR